MSNQNLLFGLNNKEFTCCICGKRFNGFGNNPEPAKSEGECCDNCNDEVVVPARLKQLGL